MWKEENQRTWRKTLGARQEPTANSTHTWHGPELNSDDIGGRRALLPLCHPCFPALCWTNQLKVYALNSSPHSPQGEEEIQVNLLSTHHFSCNTSCASSTKKNIPNSRHSHYSSNNLGGEHSFTLDTPVNKNPCDVREYSMWSPDKCSNISPL